MSSFANIFKNLRICEKLTQEEISQKLSVSKSTVAMWETGKRMPVYEKMEEIADYFNVDLKYLTGKQSTKKIKYISEAYEDRILKIANEVKEYEKEQKALKVANRVAIEYMHASEKDQKAIRTILEIPDNID